MHTAYTQLGNYFVIADTYKTFEVILQMGHVDRYTAKSGRKDIAFTWANVYEPETHSSLASGNKKILILLLQLVAPIQAGKHMLSVSFRILIK